jgi:hypothetical protein
MDKLAWTFKKKIVFTTQKKNSICLSDANANEKVYLSAFKKPCRKKKLEAEVNSLLGISVIAQSVYI